MQTHDEELPINEKEAWIVLLAGARAGHRLIALREIEFSKTF